MSMSARVLGRRDLLRELGVLAGGFLAAPLVGGCAGRPPERLSVTPAAGSGRPVPPGLHVLGLAGERDGVLYVPSGVHARSPLILMLHGAGGSGRRTTRLLTAAADATGCILLAPDSRGRTWDAVTGGFGPDVRFIERALTSAFARRSLDAGRVALAGFSDGATYALALGRANGELFSDVLAFSPGYLVPAHRAGHPRIYVSHGWHDPILPIDACSRVLVPLLRRDGYDVLYREFDGRHEVPPAVAREAVDWFLAPSPPRATTLPQ